MTSLSNPVCVVLTVEVNLVVVGWGENTSAMSQGEAIHSKLHCSPHSEIESPPPTSSALPPLLSFPMESMEGDMTSLATLKSRLAASLKRNHALEEENRRLKQEVSDLKSQITSLLGSQNAERKPMMWKKAQNSVVGDGDVLQDRRVVAANTTEELFPARHGPPTMPSSIGKEGALRIPKPPPPPPMLSSDPLHPLPKAGAKEAPPPPPPPPPSKLHTANVVRRVPEVLELYRALTRREARPDSRHGVQGTPATNAREMIGEIENRSSYLLAIKSNVETHGDFIRLLTKEVQNAAYRDISEVDAFVKWLDQELSYLVDERAVLKHFPHWPERKADAMREAACTYRDMKNLEAEVRSYQDNPGQPALVSLKRMQALQDKLEQSVHNLERIRDGAKMRYRELQIPWEWMLDSGIVAQLKSASMMLAKDYMTRVVVSLQSGAFSEEEDLMLHGVRFAFRVHQFAGGFDQGTRHAFHELRMVASRHFALPISGQFSS